MPSAQWSGSTWRTGWFDEEVLEDAMTKEKETFQPGDVVRLKGGGPKMTVSAVQTSGTLSCRWFEGSTLHGGTFSTDTVLRAGK
jgi:uncharacterized protein YodC (DUF2158 family)